MYTFLFVALLFSAFNALSHWKKVFTEFHSIQLATLGVPLVFWFLHLSQTYSAGWAWTLDTLLAIAALILTLSLFLAQIPEVRSEPLFKMILAWEWWMWLAIYGVFLVLVYFIRFDVASVVNILF